MSSRTPGRKPDAAEDLLGRWQQHHAGEPSVEDHRVDDRPEDPLDEPPPELLEDDDAVDDVPDDPGDDLADDGPQAPPEPPEPPRSPASPGRRHTPAPQGADQIEAGREVVEALGLPAPQPPERTEDRPAGAEAGAIRASARARYSAPPLATGASTDIDFPPRLLARRVLGLVLLLLVPMTGAAAYVAYQDQTTVKAGVAGLLLITLVLVYGVRATTVPVHLGIHSGHLEVVRGRDREVFDLTSRFTRMEVVGKAGARGWKVLMGRFGRDPLVIDSSMVDPAAFMEALERHRR